MSEIKSWMEYTSQLCILLYSRSVILPTLPPLPNDFRHRFLQKKKIDKGALFISGIEVQCVSVSEHVWVGGGGLRGGVGVGGGMWGGGGCQPGVYVPLKALFLVQMCLFILYSSQ